MANLITQEMLDAHGKWWRSGGREGVRLVLTGADLTGADLTDAVLTDAVLRRADLTGAVLRRAVLRGADLTEAVLRGADLTGADLTGAVLRRADLTRADLTEAVLRGADLTGAVLRRADLTGAVLRRADLTGAVLRRAVLRGADLTGAVLRRADLTEAVLTGADIPKVERPYSQILARIEENRLCFHMGDWHMPLYDGEDHACGTAHCMAGHLIDLAGEAGYALERQVGPAAAGALISLVSCPHNQRVPDFYAGDEAALAEIRERAAQEAP